MVKPPTISSSPRNLPSNTRSITAIITLPFPETVSASTTIPLGFASVDIILPKMIKTATPQFDFFGEKKDTLLCEAGWSGCVPPLVCVDCSGSEPREPCLKHTGGAHVCHLHEEYLSPGKNNADTFRCLDGTCIVQAGPCNGARNCDDGSDESGCDEDSNPFVPAYLSQSSTCPDDFHNDVHFRCANNQCIEKVGLCNGLANCADGSDEAQCSGTVHVTVEATSGRHVTVETLQMNTGVFHDRDYNFDSLGHFQGKTFIKYSNDDKATDHNKVMTKLRTLEPVTVFIVKLDQQEVSWLIPQGYTSSSSFAGVSFSGVQSTRHKEWDESLLTTDTFAATSVWKKTFPAGTISIPGNGGGDGSFLIFVDWPSVEDEYDDRLVSYWEHGSCGIHGNDYNWDWCGQRQFSCAVTVETDLCPSGTAELAETYGTGEHHSYSRGGCSYMWFAQYRCTREIPEIGGEAEFIGCFVDDGARDLGEMVGVREDMTTNTFELCRARCGDSLYMSLQFGGECFCSNTYGNAPQYVQVDESHCNTVLEPCSSHSYNCGGNWHQAIYQINRIVQWDLIAAHEYSAGLFPQDANENFLVNANDPTAAVFMNIGNLDPQEYRVDGKFHFRLTYTDVDSYHSQCHQGMPTPSGTQQAEWTQTSWITEAEVTGFHAISPENLAADAGQHGCGFTGLAPSSRLDRAIFDGSHTSNWWFGSVGTNSDALGGIPSIHGGKAQSMTLYVQRA